MTSEALKKIDHIVLVMFENRSFDHVLGWMSHPRYGGNANVDGLIGPIDAATGELAEPSYRNPALNQTFRPFFLDKDAKFFADLPHSRHHVDMQMAHSRVTGAFTMRGFAQAYYDRNPGMAGPFASQPDALRMLAPTAAPVTAFLAENYCVCDRWFTPIPTDTHPNRCMAMAGETQIDSTGSLVPNHEVLFDWAEARGVSWRVYSDEFSFMAIMRPSTLSDRLMGDRYRGFESFARDYQHDDAFPAITWIEPAFLDDPFAHHPNCNHPPLPMGPGEAFLLQVYNAMVATPAARQRFDKTLLLVYYDEHGGFFDHVPPIPLRTQCAGHAGWPEFETSGPRVPAIIVSPRVDPGVYSENLDHTSVLRCLAERFTPGRDYSVPVAQRHAQQPAGLHSLSDVVTRMTPRALPATPTFGRFKAATFPAGRAAQTPSEQAFAKARHEAHDGDDSAIRATHPRSFFIPR